MIYRGCDLPEDLAYDVDHDVWARLEADGSLTLGMTDPAQTRCGKLAGYGRAMERLERHGVPLVPHIVLGLHYGRMRGEWRALELVAARRVKLLVLVVLMPLHGTAMAAVAPPPVEEVGRFFADARRALPDTPIALGCARPPGPVKAQIDRLAVDAGFAGVAYPAEGTVAYAEARGLRPELHDACCGVGVAP